jgi:hypothetical protein
LDLAKAKVLAENSKSLLKKVSFLFFFTVGTLTAQEKPEATPPEEALHDKSEVRAPEVYRSWWEGVDYNASAQAGYPWSGNFDSYLGYGFMLWGQKKKDPKVFKDVLYGYIRPNLRFKTSGIANSLEARLDLYPISFVGLTLGQVFSYTNLKILGDASEKTGVDCDTFQCGGLLFRSFMEAKLKGGFQNYFAVFFSRADFLVNSGKKARGFVDTSASLVGGGRSDVLTTHWLKVGTKLANPKWAMGVHLERKKMMGTGEEAFQEQIFVSYLKDDWWSFGGAIKAYQTPTKKFVLGAGIQVNWDGRPSLEL